jgi:stage II sporulation protein D
LSAAERTVRRGALLGAAVAWLAGCAAFSAKPPAPVPEGGASGPPPASGAAAPGAPVPGDVAPSGILFRVGLKSDATELTSGAPGQRWSVVSAGRAEVVRSPLRFRAEGVAASTFRVQAGAFSQEEPARRLLGELSSQWGTSGTVAFSADRGVYRVLLGAFPDRAAADAFAQKLRAAGQDALPVEAGAPAPAAAPAALLLQGEDMVMRRLAAPVDVYPADPDARVVFDGKPYRGSLRVLVNPRGTINAVNRVDLEEYLYGVVPAEMGPKRFDELEGLKAQAVAARTYALAHRGQFESEGYDLCATPKCQVYAGASAEDVLSTAAVDATRGLVLAFDGKFADALFVSTCGGRTENVENVFGDTPAPYLVSVECGELQTTVLPGAALDKRARPRERTGLEWRGYVLARHVARRSPAPRAAALSLAQEWAGVNARAAPPPKLSPAAVYPSLIAAFSLSAARDLHLLPRDAAYYGEPPAASGALAGAARDAYDFLLRFRFGAGEPLPSPERALDEEEYGGLLFSAALRLTGVTEGSGRFVRREGSNVWVKAPEGRQGLPVDPELPLARKVGDRYLPAAGLVLRPGDRLRWWKRGPHILALWVEQEAVGPAFERDSAWTEWVRRASARELARRMAGRVAGSEVREIEITKRSPAGRAIEMRVSTDTAEVVLKRFDVRQALELPEMLFTVERAIGPQGEPEFVFLGRGWGHGVGLCQNGAYGMALAGASFDAILRHYYIGIDIVPWTGVQAGPPSTR